MKKAKKVLSTLIFVSFGVYLGKWIALWLDYSLNPGLYALFPAPWYSEMIPFTMITAAILLAESMIYFIVRHIDKLKHKP